jgi:hypothetical protein
MTVSSQVNRKDYAGNGSTVNFATEFSFQNDTDLKVILTNNTTLAEITKTLATDYTVVGKNVESGGTVTMIVAPLSGETLTIKRNVPATQNTDYVENDSFPADAHEKALDKLTMLAQQQQEELDRSLKLSEGQISSGLEIPPPVEGQFLRWDSEGNLLNVDISTLGSVDESTLVKQDSPTGAANMPTGTVAQAPTASSGKLRVETDTNEAVVGVGSNYFNIANDRKGIAAGAVDVITVAFSRPVLALVDSLSFQVRSLGPNITTTPTINIDGLGAVTIVKNGNQPLELGDTGNAGNEMFLSYTTANGGKVEFVNPVSTGLLIQRANVQSNTVITTTAIIPLDNTIPQITEGVQVMELPFTPKSSSNILYIKVNVALAASASQHCGVALFVNAVSDALATGMPVVNAANTSLMQSYTYKMVAGVTTNLTFRVRVGGHTGSTVTFNGLNSSSIYGGTVISSITITEYLP